MVRTRRLRTRVRVQEVERTRNATAYQIVNATTCDLCKRPLWPGEVVTTTRRLYAQVVCCSRCCPFVWSGGRALPMHLSLRER